MVLWLLLPFIAYYLLAAFVAWRSPQHLKHLAALHPLARWRRR